MRVIFNIDKQYRLDKPTAIALGTFDGIHIGHQMLVQQLEFIQKVTGSCALVYTFLNNPMELLTPEKAPTKIMTIGERISKLKSFASIDCLVLNPFDKELASMQPENFIDMLISYYNVKNMVVGYDFKFGRLGSGNIELLKELSEKHGFELVVVPPLSLGGEAISSSLIRRLIQEGELGKVSMYLGHPYTISGKIVHGFGRGKKLGFPTANLQFDPQKSIPKYGIYLTRIKIDGLYHWGVTNVGINPTFNQEGLFIETYILDYNDQIYGSKVKVEFLKRIRDEIRFSNIEDLKAQIAKDIEWAKNYVYKFR